MRGDGKDRFYRTLNLDNESKEILKFIRKHEQELKEEIEEEENGIL